jgi:hypothetical protein
MRRINRTRLKSIFLTLGFLLGCKETEFTSLQKPSSAQKKITAPAGPANKSQYNNTPAMSGSPQAVSDTASPTGLSISCDQEKAQTVQIGRKDVTHIFVPKICVSDSSAEKKPTDIVFVIDVTGSMEKSLTTVKNGVEQLASKLRLDRGWDARFAAIGFRDSIVATVPFTNEKSLAMGIRSWAAIGGDDPQEAGQSALAYAVQLIRQDFQSTPSRQNASKVILFIGDAVSYALNNNHSDLSTTQLEAVFSSIPINIKERMKFYHSSAAQTPICTPSVRSDCSSVINSTDFAARKQMTSFAQNIRLPGRGFEFPFTESIMLKEFVEEFVPSRSCTLAKGVARSSNGTDIGHLDSNGQLLIPSAQRGQNFTLEVERCCSNEATGSPGTTSLVCSTTKKMMNFKF